MGNHHSRPCLVLLFKRAEQWYNILCSVGSHVLMVKRPRLGRRAYVMIAPRVTAIISVCIWLVSAIACCPIDADAASRSRSSGGARSSVSRSRGGGGGASSFRQVPRGSRVGHVRSRGGTYNQRSVMRSPTRSVQGEPMNFRSSPDRVRVSPSTSRHPAIRDPAHSVGRTVHRQYDYTTPYSWSTYYYNVDGYGYSLTAGLDYQLEPRWLVRGGFVYHDFTSDDTYDYGPYDGKTTQIYLTVMYLF